MDTDRNNLMETAYKSNMWVFRDEAIKAHLSNCLADIRKQYFTDDRGEIRADYPAFFADILRAHNDLYALSLPCRALWDDDTRLMHQKAVKHFRTLDGLLVAGGDIHFKLHGWSGGDTQGVNILSIRVQKGTRGAEWDTRELSYLPGLLGFDDLCNIVTDITEADARYKDIRDALRRELAKGWTGDENATWMAPVRTFARQCLGLDETLQKYLPGTTNKARADMIIRLFALDDSPRYIDPKKFAEFLTK